MERPPPLGVRPVRPENRAYIRPVYALYALRIKGVILGVIGITFGECGNQHVALSKH